MISATLLPGLREIGIRNLPSFRFLRHISTAAPTQLENFLINSLGFSPEAASAASKKVYRPKSLKNDPNLVITFFQNLGLNNHEIVTVVSSLPQLLTYSVVKTLDPKIRVLTDLGLSRYDLVKLISVYKSVLSRGVESQKCQIEYLRNMFGSYENVAKALRKCPFLLHTQALQKLEYGISLMRNAGLSEEHISWILVYYPVRVLRARSPRFQDIFHDIDGLGIPRGSKRYFYAFKFLSNMAKSTIDEKLSVFQSFGWSEPMIKDMLRRFPSILGTSSRKLKEGLNYFMTELGYGHEMLASYPVVLCLNLDKMKLKNEVLRALTEKKLNHRKRGLFLVLKLTDSQFMQDYVLPYRDVFSGLYELYVKKISNLNWGNSS